MKKFLLLPMFAVFIFVLSVSICDAAAIPADPVIKLDKNVYTWTDRVHITVISPSQNLDPNKIDTIGNGTTGKITISTRGNSITPYTLVETGPDTGVFTGFVTLTGNPTLKNIGGVDGSGKEPTGDGPSGTGPKDGLLPAEDSDGISVSIQITQNHSVTSSALIRWNVGQMIWLQTNGPSSAHRILQIVDHDMNLNPNAPDTFSVPVFSNSDLAGIKINMTETGSNNGIFHGIVRFTNDTSFGSRLHLSGGNNTITGEYTDRTLPAPYTPADQIVINETTTIINGNTTTGQPMIKLDKNMYTWTDRVNITLISQDLNLNSSKIEIIGNDALGKITVSTRGHSISNYKLVETGPDTGIFTGHVILTGDPKIKDIGGVDGDGAQPTGTGPSGLGSKDGLLPAENIDGISVTFQGQHTIIATAPIQWNIGQVNWLKSVYPATGRGVCQIVDQDMNLNPTGIDKFYTNAWSTSDSGGIKLIMNETGKSTGVFQGAVFFTNSTSSGSRLQVGHGDTVTCEYKDRTLPSPYIPADQLRLIQTTLIGTTVPQLERVQESNPRITDSFGNVLTGAINIGQQIQIAADLTNNQNIDQPFAYLVQIKDQNGITVSLSWITGTLVANVELTPAQAWTPTASGTYTAQIFVFQSIDNPLQISKPLVIPIVVEGGTFLNYNSTSIFLSGAVNPPIKSTTVTLLVFNPDNNFVQVTQADVASNGKFSTAIKAGGPLFTISGTYTVKVEYGGVPQNKLSFNY